MSDRTNRHGIPMRGLSARLCCWSGCQAPPHGEFPLCPGHARHVHDRIAESDARIEANIIEAALWRTQRVTPIPPPPPEAEPKMGHVYYVRNDAYIKIGWTSDLDKRMRHYPPGSTLLAVHSGTRADEAALHKRFAVHRTHGREWYPLAAVITQHVEKIVREHGQPEVARFGAKPVEVPTPRPRQYTKPKGYVPR